ncbi:30S ribosomal protein S16 [Candidatus Nomurabacteria bacterium]|nr:30S ribosomal protein S16 [Candidatus Nomurabacteria bacterium]
MLAIRFQRLGRKKAPTYRVIVSEKHKDTQAGSLEILGHYHPVAQPKIIELNTERILHWISKGAQPSNSVHNLLVREGIIEAKKKKKSVTITNKRQGKLDKKKQEAEDAKKAAAEKAAAEKAAAEEAKKAEAEAAKAQEATPEAPAEETPAAEPQEEAPAEQPAEEAPAEEKKSE